MKIRLLSGSCYVALLVVFYCLKIFVSDFFFDGLLYLFSLLGTFEMLRAVKEGMTKKQCAIVYAFAGICIPACALSEVFLGAGLQAICFCVLALTVALLSLLVLAHDETSLEGLGKAFLSALYPTLFLSVLSLGNHLTPPASLAQYGIDSKLFILLVFVISPCADSIAYVFGRFLKKYFPKKMAPKLSPNKTVIGGIGGLVGGVLGALVLYFAVNGGGEAHIWLPIYLVMGLLGAVATAFGDLVESCIKRKVGLKDMGKIMPGHGGALDRLDGVLFTSVINYLAFMLLYVIF